MIARGEGSASDEPHARTSDPKGSEFAGRRWVATRELKNLRFGAADLGGWAAALHPELELGFTPIPLPKGAPVTQARVDGHVLNLSFTADNPKTWWHEQHAAAEQLERDGIGRMLWTAPFIPTRPGTDEYTDQLW